MNPLDAITNLIGNTKAATLRWLVCRECGHILEHDMSILPPADPCVACGRPFNRVTMPSLALAEQASARNNNLNKIAQEPAVPQPKVEVVPAAVETPTPPAEEQKSRSRKPRESRTAKPEPQTAPASALELPVEVETATGEVIEAQVPEKIDYKVLREEAKAALLAKFPQISAAGWTKVAIGRQLTYGFSVWIDGKPETDWYEQFDDSTSFGARFHAAKESNPALTIDQCKVAGLPEELQPFAFAGGISATLRPVLQTGIRPANTSKVELSVKLSRNGGLVWGVTGCLK